MMVGFQALSQNSLLQKSAILGKTDFCGLAGEPHHYSISAAGTHWQGPKLDIGCEENRFSCLLPHGL